MYAEKEEEGDFTLLSLRGPEGTESVPLLQLPQPGRRLGEVGDIISFIVSGKGLAWSQSLQGGVKGLGRYSVD